MGIDGFRSCRMSGVLYGYEVQHGLGRCRVLQHVQLGTETEQERNCSTDKEQARVG